MPKVNVYLPDTLAAARNAQLPISEICQRALTAALGAALPQTVSAEPTRHKERIIMQSLEERGG